MDYEAGLQKKCIELALEGERLCRVGDTHSGINFLESALAAGTDDLNTLSAIYSQLGNAYFYIGDFLKALEFHRHDLTLARTVNDRLGEAKASGNLGNTLKVLGKFDEAIACCKRHLEISRELSDPVGEARAYYSLGNIYHAKSKHAGRAGYNEPGDIPQEMRQGLLKAVEYYRMNLSFVQKANDKAAQGRALGNLGNTYYLLGDFSNAVCYHNQRLTIAREFGDKPALRRAYSNLGNAFVFLGEFETAIEHYKLALQVAVDMNDAATEAQACYSLANTFTLIQEYRQAVEFYIRHLTIARLLMDKVGQARAAWSLGNAFTSLGEHSKALYFINLHLQLSREIGDVIGEATASQAVTDLQQVLASEVVPDDSADPSPAVFAVTSHTLSGRPKVARKSMDNLDIISLTPDKLSSSCEAGPTCSQRSHPLPISQCDGDNSNVINRNTPDELFDDESFLDLLANSQSKRMDDQRCDPRAIAENKENRLHRVSDVTANRYKGPDEFLEMIVGIQSRRMDDQRAELPALPGLQNPAKVLGCIIERRKLELQQQRQTLLADSSTAQIKPGERPTNGDRPSAAVDCEAVPIQQQQPTKKSSIKNLSNEPEAKIPDDDFFEMLMRCQGSRIEEQRSELPKKNRCVTVPEDDLFHVILRLQAGRIDEQRAILTTNDSAKKCSHPSEKDRTS